jgi:hypothetical protein
MAALFIFSRGMYNLCPKLVGALEAGMIWIALKQTGADIWDEILSLLIFNVITLVGMVLSIPWPFVTFGLFEMAYDIGQGKGVKFSAFLGGRLVCGDKRMCEVS